jgi:hypothetical protein
MANGFYRDHAACREFDAERQLVRHWSNSFNTRRPISPIEPRLFRNTLKRNNKPPNLGAFGGTCLSRFDAMAISPMSIPDPPCIFQRPVQTESPNPAPPPCGSWAYSVELKDRTERQG